MRDPVQDLRLLIGTPTTVFGFEQWTPTPATGPAPLSLTYHYTLANLSSPPSSLKSPVIDHPSCAPVVYASGDADLDWR